MPKTVAFAFRSPSVSQKRLCIRSKQLANSDAVVPADCREIKQSRPNIVLSFCFAPVLSRC